MRPPFVVSLLAVALLAVAFAALPSSEAPTGFDNQSNGMVDDATHQADQVKFDEVENVSDGLGPLYNAQSCRECHQSPVSGGGSQVAELRVGHEGAHHRFENAEIPIARGTEIITGRTLVNDRAICPNGAFPNTEIQERLPDSENVRTTRLSLSLLGDGFVEAVADQTFIELARKQCKETHHKICGQAILVPILEAPGQTGVGRFGWKDQHASLLSFSGDAYLNEMGHHAAVPRRGDQAVQHRFRAQRCARSGRARRPGPLCALHPRYQGAGARRATGSDAANQARLRAVREGRLCHLPRARFDHRTRRNQDQWWEIHHFRRAGSEDLPSLFGFPDAQRGDG